MFFIVISVLFVVFWIMGIIKLLRNGQKIEAAIVLVTGLLFSTLVGWIVYLFVKKNVSNLTKKELEVARKMREIELEKNLSDIKKYEKQRKNK